MAPRRARRILPQITYEEATAKEAEYSSKHHEPVVKPTEKTYQRTRYLWEEFLKYIKNEGPCLQKHEEIPSSGRLKHFMEWVYETSAGILSEHVTFKSLKNTWYQFRTMYFRTTDQAIPEETGTDFIKTALRQRGLAAIRRQKGLADALDVGWLLTYMWCYDKHEFRHPRYTVQIGFITLLIVYTGARPGTIVESSAYRGSNEALCYKDFELIGLPTGPNNTLEFILKVRFRYEKGNRDKGGNDDVKYKWVTFREDRTCRGRCPVTHFFGLAFADDVFIDLKEARQIKYLKSPGRDACLPLRFKESKKDMLIFRHCNRDGTIDPHRAMNYDETAIEMLELGMRLGFRDALRLYNLRRGTANEVDGDVRVSQNQYSQLLGHAVKVMGASYISSISAVDVQGIINHETLRQDHIRLLRSMRLHLNPNAPSQLPFAECKAVLGHPELVEFDNHLNLLEQERQTKGDSAELRQQYLEASWRRKHCFERLYREARLEFRDKSFDIADSNKIRKMIEDGENGVSADEVDEKVEAPRMDFISKVHFPDRFIIASGFWTRPPCQDFLPDTSLIQSLQNMCRAEEHVQYYYGEAPVDGYCPVCKKRMAELPRSQRPDHIHDCFADMHKKQAETDFSSSRPMCCKWGKCKSQFVGKRTYLPDNFANDISDVEERRRLAAKESKRLHDLRRRGKEDLTSHKSADQALPSRKSISGHLKRHISKNQTLCLWDNCGYQCTSEQELKRHLWKSHGVTLKQACFEPQFCFEHPDSGWFTDEFDWEDHCEIHIKVPRHRLNLTRSYYMLTAGLQCPFCWKIQATFSKRFTQFKNRGAFNRHMETHDKAYRDHGPMQCPVSSCTEAPFVSYFDLQIHLSDIHDLMMKGFTRSHGLRQEKDKRLYSTSEDGDEDESEEESLGDLIGALGLENICKDDLEDNESDWTDEDLEDAGEDDTSGSKRKMLSDIDSCKRQKL